MCYEGKGVVGSLMESSGGERAAEWRVSVSLVLPVMTNKRAYPGGQEGPGASSLMTSQTAKHLQSQTPECGLT